ncbi:Modification methylase VspI [Gimesia algae]|uniref:site-specific DNA-methyltransferase (adenine-specific) n=1 Tax=Gimesia algae TaxID=2527971 RepID=A0A517V600_9PLAN|nr:Modification methylase VspI [Gimesia algae]
MPLDDLAVLSLTIAEAADALGVSTASVRNWIKAGYLISTERGSITRDSFDEFRKHVAGQEKLVTRANKSQKDSHDHGALSSRIRRLLTKEGFDCALIGGQYQDSLSDAYRNQEGIYYTPEWITERFFTYLPAERAGLRFCDPCCGSGNFILAAVDQGFSPENIFGFDIDPVAVAITRRRLLARTGYDSPHIQCADFLETSLQAKSCGFDVIFTNPPWGKKLSKAQKQAYATQFSAGNSSDTCSLFFFASLTRLQRTGYLGLLLPDAFFNVATFATARRRALSRDIKALMDFGKPFPSLITKAKGIVLQNQTNPHVPIICEGLADTTERTPSSFQQNPKSILNFSCSPDAAAVIAHLYAQDHLKLADHARFGLGIVTGNNKKYCVSLPQPGYLPVYKGADLKPGILREPSLFIPADFSLYHQVAPQELYDAPEKLIYRFISSRLVFHHDTTQSYFLNSVNMLVPKPDLPITGQQLCQLLNSRVMNWLFQSIFETHKVLRADIGALPIHTRYFETHDGFDDDAYANFLGIEETDAGGYRIKESREGAS